MKTPTRSAWKAAAGWLIAFALACAWDRAVWLAVTRDGRPVLRWLDESIRWDHLQTALQGAAHFEGHAVREVLAAAAYGLVYYFGRIWPWIALALVFIFRHWSGTDGARVRAGLRRGVFVFIVPAVAGLVAEAVKFFLRRERPHVNNGFYSFRLWPRTGVLDSAFWSTSDLGLASSHAAVAFGGAFAAGTLMPRWRIPLFTLAALCALSRVAVGAHFLSDAVAGIAIAYACYALIYDLDLRNNRGVLIAPPPQPPE